MVRKLATVGMMTSGPVAEVRVKLFFSANEPGDVKEGWFETAP
jgi:hypothetical protein